MAGSQDLLPFKVMASGPVLPRGLLLCENCLQKTPSKVRIGPVEAGECGLGAGTAKYTLSLGICPSAVKPCP